MNSYEHDSFFVHKPVQTLRWYKLILFNYTLMRTCMERLMTIMRCVIWICIFLSVVTDIVKGQGRLLSPPGRSSLWRFGYGTPINYNDNALTCGGIQVNYFLLFFLYSENWSISIFYLWIRSVRYFGHVIVLSWHWLVIHF